MIYIYNSAIKNEILSFATTWMNLEGIMLSETSKTEKDKYHIISLTCGIFKKQTNKKNKLIDTENRWVDTRGGW